MKKFTFTVAKKSDMREWNRSLDVSISEFVDLFSRHEIRENKNGACFVPGKLAGSARKAASVLQIDTLVYDVDGHQPLEDVLRRLSDCGKFAIVYSSHNHRAETTDILVDKFDKWATRAKVPSSPPTVEALTQYLQENGKGHLYNVRFSTDKDREKHWAHKEDGMVWIVHHDPVEKFRVVIPLKEPIILSELALGSTRAIKEYKKIYHGVGQALGLQYDTACEDPSRLYYYPSCREKDKSNLIVEGCNIDFENPEFLDWREYPKIEFDSPKVSKQGSLNTPVTENTVLDKNGSSINLLLWEKKNREFDIEDLLRRTLPDEMLGHDRSTGGGYHVECPFVNEHSTTKMGGTFCVNGDEEYTWNIYCSHDSCKSAGRRKLDFLGEYIRSGYIVAADLGVEVVTEKPDKETVASALGVDLDTLPSFDKVDEDEDRSEEDLVEARFAEDELLSKEDVYELCRKDIAEATQVIHVRRSLSRMLQKGCDIDYDDILEVLSLSELSGKGIRDIIAALARKGVVDKDNALAVIRDFRESRHPLTEAVKDLYDHRYAGTPLFNEWDRLASHYLVDSSLVEATYQRYQQDMLIQEHGVNINREIQRLNARYAKISDGGAARFLDMPETRRRGEPIFISQSQLSLNLKNRNETFLIESRKGKKQMRIFAYDRWLEDSKEIKEFNGITFVPHGAEVIDGLFNIWHKDTGYQGFPLKPKEGDCSLILNHIRDVWCGGQEDLFNWVMMWFAGILQRPHVKPATALIMLGDEGSGKSVIMEYGFAKILGYMYGGSGDREDIVGRWTSNLFGKLLWLSEETLFAGDKKAMNILKDRIASKTMGIEYKFANKFYTPSYTRFIFTSNQLHALHLDPKDRRFCVLSTTDKWQQNIEYFTNIRQYLETEGAAHLMHYLLTFRPEDHGLAWEDLWKTPYTEGKRRQAEMSLEASDIFFLELIKYGRITDTPSSVFLDERVSWPLRGTEGGETSFVIKPSRLKSAYDTYLRFHAGTSAKFDRNKFSANFIKYIGKGESMMSYNKVMRREGETQRVLVLPYREELLEYAVKKGFITEAEKVEALDSPNSHLYNDSSDVL